VGAGGGVVERGKGLSASYLGETLLEGNRSLAKRGEQQGRGRGWPGRVMSLGSCWVSEEKASPLYKSGGIAEELSPHRNPYNESPRSGG
jgi:hypothetical protein